MKLIKKHPAALSVLFAASLLVPAVSVVHAVDQAEVVQKVSDTISSGKSMASGINVEDASSENLLNDAKDKAADIIGQGESTASDAQAKTEQQLETAKETTAEPAKDKLNALADSEEASAVEAQAEVAVEGDAQLEASTKEADEPGFFDKLKSKVKELTSSDDAEAAKDETFVSDN